MRVPEGVAIDVFGEVGIGQFDAVTFSEGGFGVEESVSIGGTGRGLVIATLEVGIGEIQVDLRDRELFGGEFNGDDRNVGITITAGARS